MSVNPSPRHVLQLAVFAFAEVGAGVLRPGITMTFLCITYAGLVP
jgi:hypothetical protein